MEVGEKDGRNAYRVGSMGEKEQEKNYHAWGGESGKIR